MRVKVKVDEILNREQGFSIRFRTWLENNRDRIFTAVKTLTLNKNTIYYILKEDRENRWLFEEKELEPVGTNKFIYIINGRPRSGKDTFVEYVGEYADTVNYSSIDCVKELAMRVGWDGGKEPKDRAFLSDMKHLLIEYNNFPTKKCVDKAFNFLHSSNAKFLFLHVREPEEINKLKKEILKETDFVRTVLVERPGIDDVGNSSDDDVGNYKYDIYVYNDGTLSDFKKKAKDFVVKSYNGEL